MSGARDHDVAMPNTTKIEPRGLKSLRHEGTDETPPNRYFKVVVKIPVKGDQWKSFVNRLNNQARIAQASLKKATVSGKVEDGAHGVITVYVPIEDANSGYSPSAEDQITVDWPISPQEVV